MNIAKEIYDEIWILSDGRAGTVSQSIGLAEELSEKLGYKYKVIDISYGIYAKLPNFFLTQSLSRLSLQGRKDLNNLKYFPRIIISAGRRSAPISLALRKESKNQIKIIQIMHPNIEFNKFDFVILPKHDRPKELKHPNLITTIGALTRINEQKISNEMKKFHNYFRNVDKPKISLLIGGNSKNTKFGKESAITLAKLSSKIAKNMNAKLFILTSPRTGEKISKIIEKNLDCDFEFFNWNDCKDNNPYMASLGYSDFLIITGDSVSMISESCCLGKPVYIFDEKNISSQKHRRFHKNLFDNKFAKKLTVSIKNLQSFAGKKLNETKRVSTSIRSKF